LLGRALTLLYGGINYLILLGTLLYTIGFVANFLVPKSIDSGSQESLAESLIVDFLLLGLFALQHSIMARPGFKRWWTRMVPEQVERSTYVLATSVLLSVLYWQWRPMPGTVWHVEQTVAIAAIWLLFGLGWVIVLLSTFEIDHFDLFGMRQVYLFATGRPYSPVPFRTPALYRIVRHPLLLGLFIAFWATPIMTWGHVVFALTMTTYIFVGIQLEERDLRSAHGDAYDNYRHQVPMLFPLAWKSPKA
jgi:protein-S-isoprenylcysteine O-methyltransferase Ste14